MSRSPWRDALDGKLHIMRDLRAPAAHRSIKAYFEGGLSQSQRYPRSALERATFECESHLYAMAHDAEPFYWSNDMTNAVLRHMHTFDLHHIVQEEDLPVESGIFWFADPVRIQANPNEQNSRAVYARAILFSIAQQGAFTTFEGLLPTGREAIGVVTLLDRTLSFGTAATRDDAASLIPFLHPSLAVDTQFVEFANGVYDDFQGVADDVAHNMWSPLFLWSAFDLMQRKLVRHGSSELERGARRQAERAGIAASVQVVQWRKATYVYPDGHEPKPVDWSCSWNVRQHTRKLKSGKVVTVRPYVKGPLERPLKAQRERAHVVRYLGGGEA